MSDHYCCKRCGLRYDDCRCPPKTDSALHASNGSYQLALVESGAPRGERRWWHVTLNGVTIFESTARPKCLEVYEALRKALARPT
jgi:hypothetical protein